MFSPESPIKDVAVLVCMSLTPSERLSIILIATFSPVRAWYASFTLANPPTIFKILSSMG